MINVGIIGYGRMGAIRHESVEASGRAKVVAIADPQQDIPDGVRSCQSSEEILGDSAVNAVFICTPNHLNANLTKQALQKGKHVFCEKPPALNADQIREVMQIEMASGGLTLMYGFNHRHHDSMKKAKALIESGQYGRLLWMRGRYGKSVDPSFYEGWRSKAEFAGGGIMMDQGIHMLDLFLMMADDFDDVQAYVSNLYWNLEVEDNVFAIFRNRNGVVASLHSTMTQWRHLFSFEIFLELLHPWQLGATKNTYNSRWTILGNRN